MHLIDQLCDAFDSFERVCPHEARLARLRLMAMLGAGWETPLPHDGVFTTEDVRNRIVVLTSLGNRIRLSETFLVPSIVRGVEEILARDPSAESMQFDVRTLLLERLDHPLMRAQLFALARRELSARSGKAEFSYAELERHLWTLAANLEQRAIEDVVLRQETAVAEWRRLSAPIVERENLLQAEREGFERMVKLLQWGQQHRPG